MTATISLTFLTPEGAVLIVLVALPLAALALGDRRVAHARRVLGLPATPIRHRRRRLAITAVIGLLALAATQPALRTRTSLRARTDAQTLIVLDTSRSMAAAARPGGPTRLTLAKRKAVELAARLGDIPVGVGTFTDRVLPALFPTSDLAAFDSAASSIAVEAPPPRDVNIVATTFDALNALATQGFFPDKVRRRAVVLVTDGESRPFDPEAIAATLRDHGIQLAVVRVGSGADRVYSSSGKPEAYRPDERAAKLDVARLRAAVHDVDSDPAATVRRALGSGPTGVVGRRTRLVSLAPFAALAALLPLALLLRGTSLRGRGYAGRTRDGEPDISDSRRPA